MVHSTDYKILLKIYHKNEFEKFLEDNSSAFLSRTLLRGTSERQAFVFVACFQIQLEKKCGSCEKGVRIL